MYRSILKESYLIEVIAAITNLKKEDNDQEKY